MRSRQINFYADEPDQRALLEIAGAAGFRRYDSWQNPAELFQDSAFEANARPGFLTCFLTRDTDRNAVVFYHIAGKDYVVVDVIKSPVIEFRPSRSDHGVRWPGRFYVVTSFFNDVDAIERKPTGFMNAVEAFFRETRQRMTKLDAVYSVMRGKEDDPRPRKQ